MTLAYATLLRQPTLALHVRAGDATFLRALHSQRPGLTITDVFPNLVVERAWQRVLHDRTARRIGAALREQPN